MRDKCRAKLIEKIGGGVAIFTSAPISIRANDIDYEYRQDSDFYYLTGFEEPESVCVLVANNGHSKFILFVRPRDKEREVWDGKRAGTQGAIREFGADEAYSIKQLDEILPKLLDTADKLYYSLGKEEWFDKKILRLMRYYKRMRPRSGKGPSAIIDPSEIIHEMRLFKSDEEVEVLQQAVSIAAEAHIEAMKTVRPGMFEYEIEALIEFIFRKSGATGPAYPTIVASGPNATTLHYNSNRRRIEDGDLLLVDAGAEYRYYCSDITRTYPANGKFTAEQKTIYNIVLGAQLAAIEMIKPGVSFIDIHNKAVEVIVDGLLRIGLLRGNSEEIIKDEGYKKFFMHRTGHWLGMDVHDVGNYKVDDQWRKIEPGMIMTVEPGIYIPEETEGVPPRYWNIGVRIEDDVLVTEEGCRVLSARVPKLVDEIESLMAQQLG